MPCAAASWDHLRSPPSIGSTPCAAALRVHVGKWLTPWEQRWAPAGTHFHQFVVPPVIGLRRDCTYGRLAAMRLPADVRVHAGARRGALALGATTTTRSAPSTSSGTPRCPTASAPRLIDRPACGRGLN
ncbi:hypothetical protein E2562_030606 [Oryza meyeriana var. granulata]|uniref:Very-long-chain aldehyde decarbonylase CER1-like C-terminal domain-containing protein n=1 Tax=Oryza meyeriana var. granulata TaxID=110450 RepID=A0A6G1CIJ5_9ORYZ|nr:hypothetical protein E2562_030606 [Oryza meyeriana var. granulata]